MPTRYAKKVIQIVFPILLAAISFFFLATTVPETEFVQESLASIEKSSSVVMDFAGATMSASLAISALPDDFASPLANSLADMNIYFVLILVMLFLERLLVVEGIRFSFAVILPAACGLYAGAALLGRAGLRRFGTKLAVLGLAVVLAIPCSTVLTERIGADYLAYVEQTIEETDSGADKINEAMTEEDAEATIFDKLSDAFKTAIRGVNDLLDYFKNVIKRSMNSIAILIVTTCVMPVLTFTFFRWLLRELFSLHLPNFGEAGMLGREFVKQEVERYVHKKADPENQELLPMGK